MAPLTKSNWKSIPNQTKQFSTKPNQKKFTKANLTNWNRKKNKSNQNHTNQTRIHQIKLDQNQPNQTGFNQVSYRIWDVKSAAQLLYAPVLV